MIPASLLTQLLSPWQSTFFAAASGATGLALRKNRAHLRYWLWFAASCKFLVRFSLLVTIGSQFEWRAGSGSAPLPLSVVLDPIGHPLGPWGARPPGNCSTGGQLESWLFCFRVALRLSDRRVRLGTQWHASERRATGHRSIWTCPFTQCPPLRDWSLACSASSARSCRCPKALRTV